MALTQLAVPHLEKTRGEIVNISSIGGLNFGARDLSHETFSAHRIDLLLRGQGGPGSSHTFHGIDLHFSWHSRQRHQVEIFFFFNCSPGSISTEFFDKKGISKEVREQVFRKKICKFQIYKSHTNPVNIPLGRTGTAEDIAKVILFLADRQQSEFVIGVKWGLLRTNFSLVWSLTEAPYSAFHSSSLLVHEPLRILSRFPFHLIEGTLCVVSFDRKTSSVLLVKYCVAGSPMV